MPKPLRITLIVLAVLLLPAALAVVLLSRLDIESRFEAFASQATGLEVAARGGASLHLFPTVRVVLRDVTVKNSPPARAAAAGTHQTEIVGPLGDFTGLSFIYVHLNRLIQDTDANVIYLTGPGHGGPAPPFPTVLDARRHSEPRQRHHPRLDSRGRRTRLRSRACRTSSPSRSSGTVRRRRGHLASTLRTCLRYATGSGLTRPAFENQ